MKRHSERLNRLEEKTPGRKHSLPPEMWERGRKTFDNAVRVIFRQMGDPEPELPPGGKLITWEMFEGYEQEQAEDPGE